MTQLFDFSKHVRADFIGAVSQIVSFIIASTAPPFPVFVFSFLFAGFGMALQVGFTVHLVRHTKYRSFRTVKAMDTPSP